MDLGDLTDRLYHRARATEQLFDGRHERTPLPYASNGTSILPRAELTP